VIPTPEPSMIPTDSHSVVPTSAPSRKPSKIPSRMPSKVPSVKPTTEKSMMPSSLHLPSTKPSIVPSVVPSMQRSAAPSSNPQHSTEPSFKPSRVPSVSHFSDPSTMPSNVPNRHPSAKPSSRPSSLPSSNPSVRPSLAGSCTFPNTCTASPITPVPLPAASAVYFVNTTASPQLELTGLGSIASGGQYCIGYNLTIKVLVNSSVTLVDFSWPGGWAREKQPPYVMAGGSARNSFSAPYLGYRGPKTINIKTWVLAGTKNVVAGNVNYSFCLM
jgi:hypothetical protein